jgi:hypothetical protein
MTKRTARVLSESQIIEELGWSAAEGLAKRIQETLQETVTRAELTEGECFFSNSWDETCAKLQASLSCYWERLKPFKIGEVEFAKLEAHEREAIWLLSNAAEGWRKAGERRRAYPVDARESLEYIFEEYLLWEALEHTNKTIQSYIKTERQKVDTSAIYHFDYLRDDFIYYAAEQLFEYDSSMFSEIREDLNKRFGYWLNFDRSSKALLREHVKMLFEYDSEGELFSAEHAMVLFEMEPRDKAEWAAERISSFASSPSF